MEAGLPVNALYPYRDATDLMSLSSEGFTRALTVLLQIYPIEIKQQTKAAMAKEMKGYISVLEGRGDKDSENFFVLGKTHALMGDKIKADKYFRLTLDYYPSSGYYVYEISRYYANNGSGEAAMKVIRSFDPFLEKFRGPQNPRGIFVYRIRDLEADLEYNIGNKTAAKRIVSQNFHDAVNNVYVISSGRSRGFVERGKYVKYLEDRVKFYENK
jgi:hypothetical protein